MPAVYSYLRFSRLEQMKGDSRRRQIAKSKAWAEKNNLILDESLNLNDLGMSAFKAKNAKCGKLSLFLEAIETGRVKAGDYLVIENLDRLSRDDVFSVALPLAQKITSAGVKIVTIDPERIYSTETLKNLGTLIELMMGFFLANEESGKKAMRLSASWAEKRAKASDNKLTAKGPGWLSLTEDRKSFELVEDRVEVVRLIFRLAADGAGYTAIVKRLNADEVPTFGKAEFWRQSSVKKILTSRSVLGEFQPHRMQDSKRVPAGEPISDYFPQVIDEPLFYAARQGRTERKGRGGRNGKSISNLFTGLLKDARDGSSLIITNKGNGPQLVSSAANSGKGNSVYLSFPYRLVEQSLLVWGHDLELGSVIPRKATDLEAENLIDEGLLADRETRITTITERLRTSDNLNSLIDIVAKLEAEKKEIHARIDRRKGELATPEDEAVDGLKKLIVQLKKSTGNTLYGLRTKLRTLLCRVVADICVLVIQVNQDRVAFLDIKLKNGNRRNVTIFPPSTSITLPDEIADRDIREWHKWPKHLRETHFSVVTVEAKKMLRMEERGYTRTEIAAELGISKSQVSRALLKLGVRKQARTSH